MGGGGLAPQPNHVAIHPHTRDITYTFGVLGESVRLLGWLTRANKFESIDINIFYVAFKSEMFERSFGRSCSDVLDPPAS